MEKNELNPDEIEEAFERAEFRPCGGGRKSRPDKGFGLERKGRKVKEQLSEEARKSNKELSKAKREIDMQIQKLLRKETNPALHRGTKDYFEWVRFGLMALSETDQKAEVMQEKDIKMEYVKASGSGGQNVNKRNTAASIRHNPTMFFLKNKKTRTQFENEEQAREIMFGRLENHLKSWKRVIGDRNPNEEMADIFNKAISERDATIREVEVLEKIRKNLKDGKNL